MKLKINMVILKVQLPLILINLKIISDILEAMEYAHNKKIIHTDLHLGNIMRHNDDFLIGDFGLGKDEEVIKSLITSATPKNSHLFLDPIGLQDFRLLNKSSDIYSIGKIIEYIMCNGFISTNNIFSYITAKYTSREQSDKYQSINEIKESEEKTIINIYNENPNLSLGMK